MQLTKPVTAWRFHLRLALHVAVCCLLLALALRVWAASDVVSTKPIFANPVSLASDHAETEQVQARLIPSVQAVHPGQTVTLGVQQKIIPHWHTYWINPGDSGLATRIDWTLPKGAKAGAIQWPLPSHIDVEGITNYGYAGEVTLLTDINVPSNIAIGEKFPIHATVNWLVCAELCIPQKVELALTLPVAAPQTAPEPRDPQLEIVRTQLPQGSLWPLRVEIEALQNSAPLLRLRIVGAADALARAEEIWFYADTWGRVQHNAAQTHHRDGADIVLDLPAGENPPAHANELAGVLTVAEKSGDGAIVRRGFFLNERGFALDGKVSSGAADGEGVAAAEKITPVPASPSATTSNVTALLPALLLALFGGVILNLMPCVFPVLSIKALSLLKYANYTRAQIRAQGLAYTGGVLASFALLAGLLIALKAGGASIGWGFQYQSPLFVVAVAYLLFAVGLNLSGLFSIGNSVTGLGSSLAEKPGYAGSFFSGVLAAIVATPCTAPFMGAAIGFALTQPALILLAVFLSLGFGLALPYLALAWWPSLQRRLPRPGAWMDWLKQLLAFPMYVAAIWLLWVLAQQAGPDAVALALLGIAAIALAAWLYQSTGSWGAVARRFAIFFALDFLILAAFVGYCGATAAPTDIASTNTSTPSGAHWESYSAQRLAELRADGAPVFVNFTASWCISCLVNERVALGQAVVLDEFQKQGVTYLKGDWTNQDSEIATKLAEFGRSGVPLYLYFPRGAGKEPIVLPQILTTDIVLSALEPSAVASNH